MSTRFARAAAVALAAQLLAISTLSAQYSETLPEFSGDSHDEFAPYPLPPVAVGTFTLPAGFTPVTGTIMGTFGNTFSPTSAGVDLYLDGILVGACIPFTTCWTGPGPTPWFYAFTLADMSIFADGVAELVAVQTSEFVIRLGETTLALDGLVGVVPEPASLLLLGTGLVGMAGAARRRRGSRIG